MRKMLVILIAAVLLGAAVLPAAAYPIREFPKPFVKEGTIDYDFDGTPDVAIIIGSKAQPEDVLGAILIAMKIGSHLYYTNAPWVDELHALSEGITLYHGSFSAELYRQRYQALDLVYEYGGDLYWTFLWSWTAGYPSAVFGKIYPLNLDKGYVFVPAGMSSEMSPTELVYSIGLEVDPLALKEWVKFAPGYYPPAYHSYELPPNYAVSLTFDCPGTFTFEYDAWDTTPDFAPTTTAQNIAYHWEHAGFYFIHPLNPIDLREGTEVELPWAGYKLVVQNIEFNAGSTAYRISFNVYKLDGTGPVDYFHLENAGIPQDNNPATWDTFLYSVIHDDLYIKADVNGNAINDDGRLVPYFGITVRDADAVLDTITVDFYSLVIAPNVYPGFAAYTDVNNSATYSWFFASAFGWPHPAGSDYDLAKSVGSPNVDVIVETTWYPVENVRTIAGGNFDFTVGAGAALFNHPKGYILDENTVFNGWKKMIADYEDEAILGFSGYAPSQNGPVEWYMVVKYGTLRAGIFEPNETGWYQPKDMNNDGVIDDMDGKLTAGGDVYWFTSVSSQVYTAGAECPALPPTVTGEFCGPSCGPTWGLYTFTEGEKDLLKNECETFAYPDVLVGEDSFFPTLDLTCAAGYGKNLTLEPYADYNTVDVTSAAYHWQKNWFYPVNATGVFAGIYDRVEDRNGDGVFTGATELAKIYATEGAVFEDVTPDGYKDIIFNATSPEEVFSFVRAPVAYMDDWVTYEEDGKLKLVDEVKDKNLILIGGPAVNKLVDYLNDTENLYIWFKNEGTNWWLYNPEGGAGEKDINLTYVISLLDPAISLKYVYRYKEGNGLGVIQYAKDNPWGDGVILVVAGTDRYGTLAAAIALADPTKLYNATIDVYYNAGEGDNAPAVIVIGIQPTKPPTKVTVKPVVVVPVGLPKPAG